MSLDILFNNPLEQLDELVLEAKRLKQKYNMKKTKKPINEKHFKKIN